MRNRSEFTPWVVLAILIGAVVTPAAAQQRSLEVQGTAPPASERRIALVIGNSAYESGPLKNPVNDARAIAVALKELHFEVSVVENGDQTAMKRAIDDFGDALKGGGVGLFYYSGHGMQVKGQNYIIPINARIKGERDVEYESINVGRLLGKMEDAGNPMNIVILDACRDNPFQRSSRTAAAGLATMDAASGTFIAYATAPGKVASDGTGSNGLYTSHLIRYMKEPGLKVEDVFKRVRGDVEKESVKQQVPWESSSLKGDFFFAGIGAGQPTSTPGLPPVSAPGRQPTAQEMFEQGIALYDKDTGKYTDNMRAIQYFTECIRIDPDFETEYAKGERKSRGWCFFERASAYSDANKHLSAAEDFVQAQNKGWDNLEHLIGDEYKAARNLDEACRHWERGWKGHRNETSTSAYKNSNSSYFSNGCTHVLHGQ